MNDKRNLLLRNDTVLGVCEGLGQDFCINPTWLRIVFALGLYVTPAMVIAIYLGLGTLVALSRLVYRDRTVPATVEMAGHYDRSSLERQEQLPLAA